MVFHESSPLYTLPTIDFYIFHFIGVEVGNVKLFLNIKLNWYIKHSLFTSLCTSIYTYMYSYIVATVTL